ncbi:hypothetical protein LCGC14_0829610 [marine sediment metagenome]|uniref:Uncharacterized protein n=1 Tax=marine sediment metagenome TaxID=412755 RepID=A0A0F9S176_9ZZZZ
MSNIGQKMASMLRAKIADHERDTRCGRIDLELADYRRVGNHDYEIMVEYARESGTPASTQLNEWVTASFNGGFRLNLATIRDYPELSVVRAHMRENQIPMPMSRSASMLRLGGGRFLDSHENQWEVRQAPNGEDILVRASDVRVEDILEERISRQRNGRYARVTLDMIRTAGVADLEVGDTVLYGEPAGGQLQKTGVLAKVGAKDVSIKGRQGKLPRSYVIDVVDKNSGSKKAQDKFLIDFMAEYLFAGDKAMARKSVK